MKEFAKLFNHSKYGQILAVADEGEDDDGEWRPKIAISFTAPGMSVCTINAYYEDSEDGYDKRDAGFKDMDVDAAAKVIEPVIEDLL